MKRLTIRARTGLALAAALIWLGPVDAAEKPKAQAKKPAKESKAGVRHLFGIDWRLSVDDALKQAGAGASSKAKEKPVMVLRVLGDLDGFM